VFRSIDLSAAIGFKRHIQVLNYMLSNWPDTPVEVPVVKERALNNLTGMCELLRNTVTSSGSLVNHHRCVAASVPLSCSDGLRKLYPSYLD